MKYKSNCNKHHSLLDYQEGRFAEDIVYLIFWNYKSLIIKINVFCNVTPWNLVVVHRNFSRSCCLYHLPCRWKQQSLWNFGKRLSNCKEMQPRRSIVHILGDEKLKILTFVPSPVYNENPIFMTLKFFVKKTAEENPWTREKKEQSGGKNYCDLI